MKPIAIFGIVAGISALFIAMRARARDYSNDMPHYPPLPFIEMNPQLQSFTSYDTIALDPEIEYAALDTTTSEFDTQEELMRRSNLKRGERNNNPGNIERTNERWQGMAAEQKDSRFITFISPEYGIRALGKLLQNYSNRGFNTIETIINRYAPSSENNTSAYVNHVSQLTGWPSDEPLNLDNLENLAHIVKAIITHENGRNIYDDETIEAGINLI